MCLAPRYISGPIAGPFRSCRKRASPRATPCALRVSGVSVTAARRTYRANEVRNRTDSCCTTSAVGDGELLAAERRVRRRCRFITGATIAFITAAFTPLAAREVKSAQRADAVKRAQVWQETDIPSKDLAAGPERKDGFPAGDTVVCNFNDKKMTGRSPKFICVIAPDDELKVKYGRDNGEVYGEVAATRLLWALGFGADAMYSVKVLCRKCPPKMGGVPHEGRLDELMFDPAAVERKLPGHDIVTKDREGWNWNELDQVSEAAGGAPLAHRDALKLLAAFIQHGYSKPQQQRLVCLDKEWKGDAPCERPFMLVNDLGLTYGRSNALNRDSKAAVNFEEWSRTPIWKDKTGCVANLSGSLTGTLENPRISDEGRAFLADLLMQLSDQQIADLFEAARVYLRPRAPGSRETVSATVGEWLEAFKKKRDEIVNRRCDAPDTTKR